ncbi:uncharacterized protein BXZ73DRAFT_47665 [Epithele typhae]|uniref:uncharacterized protein n=1 Tax=Epithele typhae TaxID=378194 RepID=UPI0020075856|nr:uncharacterized protein BXZ73DRAFT_47665 [Epithele typhae]KAH9930434.1 hypothetical protein BXZ73DRAFT_47665 [Epithele typhae]
MADVQFSWSDSLTAAFSSCLPCLKHSGPQLPDSDAEDQQPSHGFASPFAHAVPPPRARPDELEGLLVDPDELSLHTNPGDRARRRKKKRRGVPKHIRVFGYDLFGRAPAIQLPESDEEGQEPPRPRTSRGRASFSGGFGEGEGEDEVRPRTTSTSTLDSDAAPLDPQAIAAMGAARNTEALAREEEERREKQERRRRRRERKELKRLAVAHALDAQAAGAQEFEGFQGSAPFSPFSPSVGSGTGTGTGSVTSSQSHSDGFGPFAHGQPTQHFDPDAFADDDPDGDGADFGGETYAATPRGAKPGRSSHSGGTRTTSDTRSSSTDSGSRGTGGSAGYAGHPHLAQQPYVHSPLSPYAEDSFPAPELDGAVGGGEKKRKKRRKSRPAELVVDPGMDIDAEGPLSSTMIVSPPTAARDRVLVSPAPGTGLSVAFEGFPGDFASRKLRGVGAELAAPSAATGQPAEAYTPVTGFPSAGLRGSGMPRRKSDAGVFLARRGDE